MKTFSEYFVMSLYQMILDTQGYICICSIYNKSLYRHFVPYSSKKIQKVLLFTTQRTLCCLLVNV